MTSSKSNAIVNATMYNGNSFTLVEKYSAAFFESLGSSGCVAIKKCILLLQSSYVQYTYKKQ